MGHTTTTDPNELTRTHLHLVEGVVRQLASRFPQHVEHDELRGAGAAGLVEAANRYDPATGIPFAHYALIRIRGAVLDATRSRDWATRRMRRDLRSVEAAAAALEAGLHRRPLDEEVASELGLRAATVRELRAAAVTSTLLALDRPIGDAESGPTTSLAERVEERDAAWLPEAALERSELLGTLHTAIAHLPELPRRVLLEHHFEGRRIREIAEDLGVTDTRVSQLRQEALHALQAYFATAFEEVPDVPPDAPGKRRRSGFVATLVSSTTWRTRLEGVGGSDETRSVISA